MDELEGVIILNTKHSNAFLGQTVTKSKKSGYTESIVISAGGKGIIRVLRVSMTVSLLMSSEQTDRHETSR